MYGENSSQSEQQNRQPSVLSGITNYYERLVLDQLFRVLDQAADPAPNQDLLEDITCLALNQLPARYVRYGIDFSAHLTPDELVAMREQVAAAIASAMQTVKRRHSEER